MRIRRSVLYTAATAAAIATAGLLASPALASTTQLPFNLGGQGFSLYNNYGHAHGSITGSQSGNQYGGQYGQYGQGGQGYGGSVSVSGTVSDNRGYGYGYGYGHRQGTIEEVFLSSNSWERGNLIGSAGPGQTGQVSGTLYNTNSGTITLCAANRWGGNVRDCTSQSFTVNNQHNRHHH